MLGGGVLQHGRRGPPAALPSAQGHPLGRRHRTDGRGCGVHLQNGHRPGHGSPYADDFLQIKEFRVLDRYSFEVRYEHFFARAVFFLDESHPAQAHPGRAEHPYHLLRPQACGRRAPTVSSAGSRAYASCWKLPHLLLGRPHISEVVFRIIPDTATMFMETRAGRLDVMELSPQQYLRQTSGKNGRNPSTNTAIWPRSTISWASIWNILSSRIKRYGRPSPAPSTGATSSRASCWGWGNRPSGPQAGHLGLSSGPAPCELQSRQGPQTAGRGGLHGQ